jgi:hypothetical protein
MLFSPAVGIHQSGGRPDVILFFLRVKNGTTRISKEHRHLAGWSSDRTQHCSFGRRTTEIGRDGPIGSADESQLALRAKDVA